MNNSVYLIHYNLRSHHLYLVLEDFHRAKRKLYPLGSYSPSPLPWPMAITDLLSAFMDTLVLNASHTWNYSLCGLLSGNVFSSFIHGVA